MDNEEWIVEEGGSIIKKKADRDVDTLSDWEQLVYCLWVVDYSIRNAGDLETAADMFPNFRRDGLQLANTLNLQEFFALLSLDDEQFLNQYYPRFDAVCNELQAAQSG